MIRQAQVSDIDAIAATYKELFDYEDKNGSTTNWRRESYPTKEVPQHYVQLGQMFVFEKDMAILASMLLNHQQGPGYESAAWSYPAKTDEVLVIHTLVVTPSTSHSGLGSQMLDFAEHWGTNHGCRSIRIDTWIDNKPAKAFYLHHGFHIVGKAHVLHWGVIDEDQIFLEKLL
jgi:ribosomal protein S18 acetylase RimI-like enzyme